VFDNVGPGVVGGTVQLVSQAGYTTSFNVSVPAGGTTVVGEALPQPPSALAGQWVGALVTLHGGMASVSQMVSTRHGSTSQPCASATASQWYFASGTTMINATDVISLVNPYPVNAIADLSFTTEEGHEDPLAFTGVVVPPHGLAVVDLGSHLRRRQHIAATVTARVGAVAAFETEIVIPPRAGAGLAGSAEPLDEVVPVPGISLTLGAPSASSSWWWPDGSHGPGLIERFNVYNPGPVPARLRLSLVSVGTGGSLGSADGLIVAPYGTAVVTTNGEPWAMAGSWYAAHLESTNGVPVVAERDVTCVEPLTHRGIGSLVGLAQPAKTWLLGPDMALVAPSLGHILTLGHMSLGGTWLEVANPGARSVAVSVDELRGHNLVPVAGVGSLGVPGGQRAGVELPAALVGVPLVVSGTAPVVVEEDSYSSSRTIGVNLSPGEALSPP
jgi:hypothetical protein